MGMEPRKTVGSILWNRSSGIDVAMMPHVKRANRPKRPVLLQGLNGSSHIHHMMMYVRVESPPGRLVFGHVLKSVVVVRCLVHPRHVSNSKRLVTSICLIFVHFQQQHHFSHRQTRSAASNRPPRKSITRTTADCLNRSRHFFLSA